MIPGQLGPTIRVLFCDLSISVMRTISEKVSIYVNIWRQILFLPCCGMPSVILYYAISLRSILDRIPLCLRYD